MAIGMGMTADNATFVMTARTWLPKAIAQVSELQRRQAAALAILDEAATFDDSRSDELHLRILAAVAELRPQEGGKSNG